MSRIGKQPILIPEGVEVQIDKQKVVIKGSKGELTRNVRPEIKVEIQDNKIIVSPKSGGRSQVRTQKENKFPTGRVSSVRGAVAAFWGLERALLQNMVIGVDKGFEKKLELRGIGYRAKVEEESLILEVGFTHPVVIKPIEDVHFSVEGSIVTVSGVNKEKVGQIAAQTRKVRPPDSYKGKGIRYLGEEIKLKPGKKAATAG